MDLEEQTRLAVAASLRDLEIKKKEDADLQRVLKQSEREHEAKLGPVVELKASDVMGNISATHECKVRISKACFDATFAETKGEDGKTVKNKNKEGFMLEYNVALDFDGPSDTGVYEARIQGRQRFVQSAQHRLALIAKNEDSWTAYIEEEKKKRSRPIHVFVDHSNIKWGARTASQYTRSRTPSPAPPRPAAACVLCKEDAGDFCLLPCKCRQFCKFCAGCLTNCVICGVQVTASRKSGPNQTKKTMCVYRMLKVVEGQRDAKTRFAAGSHREGRPSTWETTYTNMGYKTSSQERAPGQKESHVDCAIQNQVRDTILDFGSQQAVQTLCLVTGDGNDNKGLGGFPKIIENCLKANVDAEKLGRGGWKIEIWAWKRATNRVYHTYAKDYPGVVELRNFDAFQDYVLKDVVDRRARPPPGSQDQSPGRRSQSPGRRSQSPGRRSRSPGRPRRDSRRRSQGPAVPASQGPAVPASQGPAVPAGIEDALRTLDL